MFVKVKVPKMWEERDRRTRESEAAQNLSDELDADKSLSGLKTKAKEKMEGLVEDIKEA